MSWSLETLPAVVLLALLAVLLPLGLFRLRPPSYRWLAVVALLSALLLTLAGAALMALAYGLGGARLGAALANDPAGVLGLFLARGAAAVIVWGPLLALALLALSRRVEAARGEALKARQLRDRG